MSASATTYGILGMLATRSWTGYELTQQMRRSLRYVWPSSEGHLYREQRRLVALGWATHADEPAGSSRTRKRYAITPEGRRALQAWLSTEPEPPQLQVEGLLRAFYADSGTVAGLVASLSSTAAAAQEMLIELAAIAEEYLQEDGPLMMLEQDRSGEFHGRQVFPGRLPVVALTLDGTTSLLAAMQRFFSDAARAVEEWPSVGEAALAPATRRRLEAVVDRGSSEPRSGR